MTKDKELWWSRRKTDFKVDYYRSPGPGGQNVNKRSTACRLTDKETGIQTYSHTYKMREQNKKSAFQKMVKKLMEYYEGLEAEKKAARSSDQEQATRTYSEKDDRVTDHLTGKKYSYRHTVEKGDIAQLIEDRLLHRVKTGDLNDPQED